MNTFKKFVAEKGASILYALFILLFTIVFFTNDFGLTDIRKTSVVVGMGIDAEGERVTVTAQIAIPQPSESGENTTFTQVEGSGRTVGDAINDVNGKVGFYPKLTFCKLILLGEGCKGKNIFALLDYFYRNDHTQLTPVVAMCEGSASDLLSSKLPFGDTATISVERILSDESKKTGNVATVNLKCLGLLHNSVSNACYMPYIQPARPADGEGQQSGGQDGGQSGGSSGQSGEQNNGQSGGQGGEMQLTCGRTAIFKDGMYCGVLDERQAFALNLLRNEIRHAYVTCEDGDNVCTLGLRSCDGRISLSFEGDRPILKIAFKGVAQLQDESYVRSPKEQAKRAVSADVLKSGEDTLKGYFDDMLSAITLSDCDVLGVTKLLHRFNYSHYADGKDDLLANLKTEYDITLTSAA